MKPHVANAEVEERKLREYLLSETHPEGRHKARFLESFGFRADRPEQLRVALLAHLETGTVKEERDTPFGRKWVIEGLLDAPDGRTPHLVSVWFRKGGAPVVHPTSNGFEVEDFVDEQIRLVTAYPAKG